MRLRDRKLALLLATLVAGLVVETKASAQEAAAIDLPKFDPSFAGDRFFGVPSPFTPSDGVFNVHGGVVLDYAHNPLVVASSDDSPLSCGESECSVVEHQLFLHANVTVALFDRVSVNVDMPFALYQAGEGNVGNDALTLTSPSGAELGDLRVGARVRLFGEYHDAFQVGLGGYLWVPTGGSDAYVTDGSVRGQPHALVGGRADRFIWTAAVGPTLRGSAQVANVTLGHQFNWGAGAGVLLLEDRTLQLGLETSGAVSFDETEGRNTNAEVLAGAKFRFVKFMEAGLAAGPGLTNGVGTPDFRGVFTLQYTPEPVAARDSDGDGILDDVDACPTVKGVTSSDPAKHGCPAEIGDKDKDGILDDVDACIDIPGVASDDKKKHGCPVVIGDKDKDGILDNVDACVEVAGVANDDPKKNGCPPDRDGDGIIDAEDACPDLAGVASEDKTKHGCPLPVDTDGDGIMDPDDACPREKGAPNADKTKHGCPTVFITENEIVILEQVQFDTGKSTIKPVSNDLLDKVSKILKEHPEIKKLEVQGHTDSRGTRQSNVILSDARAKAVLQALVKRGIEAARLSSKGYGPDKPLDPAQNEAAWSKNRRVQFVVLQKDASNTEVKTK